MKKAIIIGATSGIGRALAKVLAKNGYVVGITGRRLQFLESLQQEIPSYTIISRFDVTNTDEAIKSVNDLIGKLGGLDLFVYNSGTGHLNPELDFKKDVDTINVNVTGFTALSSMIYNYFIKQGHGHLVGISSIAALGGNHIATSYNASKAYMSNYLQGLGKKSVKDNNGIKVTEILPGYVDTDMAKGEGKFWVASPEKAAEQIYDAIKGGRHKAYITKRWRLIGWAMKILPTWVYNKL